MRLLIVAPLFYIATCAACYASGQVATTEAIFPMARDAAMEQLANNQRKSKAVKIVSQIDPDAPEISIDQDIGILLNTLDDDIAINILNEFAVQMLKSGRPDLFKKVVSDHIYRYWSNLSDGHTALNMISWLPDTAEYLAPRITAATIAISAGELQPDETANLWRDLRVRVERVADPDLMTALCSAMIQSDSTDLMVETIKRFNTTPEGQAIAYASLLEKHQDEISRKASNHIMAALKSLNRKNSPPAVRAHIARAYWLDGERVSAIEMLRDIGDNAEQLRATLNILSFPQQNISAEVKLPKPKGMDAP